MQSAVSGGMLSAEAMVSALSSPSLWAQLKNKEDPEVQEFAALSFGDLLWSFWPHLSVGSASRRESEWSALLLSMDEGLKECVFSTFPHEILGGILLIRAVISVVTEWMAIGSTSGLSEFVSRYATYLREILLKCHLHDDRYRQRTWSVIAVCTECLGEVVSVSGNGAKSMVERDIKTALKWIGGRSVSMNVQCSEQHKVAAVWLLAEYAVSVPIFFNLEINRIVEGIVTAIRDPSPFVRRGGIRVLRECLLAISKRPHREKIQLSSRIVTDGYQGTSSRPRCCRWTFIVLHALCDVVRSAAANQDGAPSLSEEGCFQKGKGRRRCVGGRGAFELVQGAVAAVIVGVVVCAERGHQTRLSSDV